AGKPLWQLLAPPGAGAVPQVASGDAAATANAAVRLPAYASLLRYGDPELVARNAAHARAQGYRQIKLHEITVDAVAAARAAVGPDVALMMDCNCPWTAPEAIAMAERLRAFDLAWFEEPVWPPEDYPALARVRRAAGIPLSAGENAMSADDFERMFEAGAVDIAQPSVTKIGGVSAFIEVAERARRHGVRVVAHSPYFGPGLLATLHLSYALLGTDSAQGGAAAPIEYSFCELGENPLHRALAVVDGTIALPDRPGLGADPDPSTLARCAID
ncbi:MAG: mandelate racemase/muconate lactonizing enzyme family protein, partial [Proteobacteria bacterium]|nr:mandelate racemase/muconate lactonizing enzyme family protein [Burkholderiales bacterium]